MENRWAKMFKILKNHTFGPSGGQSSTYEAGNGVKLHIFGPYTRFGG